MIHELYQPPLMCSSCSLDGVTLYTYGLDELCRSCYKFYTNVEPPEHARVEGT